MTVLFGELWCIDPMCFGINTGGMDGWDKKTMTEDEWSALQKTLSNTIGQNNYANWIAPLEFSCVEGDIAVFNVPTNFLGNYVSQNFGEILLSVILVPRHPAILINDGRR